MAVSGSSFVDEIYDQFLVCRMCSEVYNNPKVLTCMHSFCEKCLETHYDMEEQERPYRFLVYNRALNCPLCHSRTELPTGGIHRLPDNFLVANLSAVVGRCKPGPSNSGSVCEICRPGALHNEADEGERRVAVSKCLDCVKLLCGPCTELHRKTRVTEHHGLFDVRAERDLELSECKRHQKEALRFYCEECEECVCVLCTFHDHRDHDVTSLVDALERHRGPFEALMERCRGRIDGLRGQVELIERCERGLKRAEERIRDAAIDAIAAIRKREKDLLTEIRDSLDEQTLGFIGEKNIFKENLKNLEGNFEATNALLSGTKLDLLIVRKEMEKKLTSVLESGMKNTPESLKRNVRLCSDEEDERKEENYYPDVVQAAFDRMERSNRETRRQVVEVQTVGTETDPDFAPDLISKLDQKDDDDGDDDDDDPETSTPDSRRDSSVWRRPMAVVVATETPRSFGTVTLRPIDGLPRTGEAGTQTPRPVLVEGSTEMPRLVVYEKETNTPVVHVLQKGVSTDNQTLVDKSTSTTLVDVTAAYRGASTTKRSVMVSRGTCTPRTMTTDRETLPVPNPVSTARGCSPVDWNSISGENSSSLHVPPKGGQENASAIPAVVGVPGVSRTPPQCRQDEQKLSMPPASLHQPSAVTAAVNTPSPLSAPTQVRPHEGQSSSRGQEVSKNPVHTSAPLNQIQAGKIVTEEPTTLSRVQVIPASQGNKDMIRGVPALPGSNPTSGIKGGQLYSQVLGPKSGNGTQIRGPGSEVQFPSGPPQSRGQTPGSPPGIPSMIGNQRSQVPFQDSANVPRFQSQTTPESQRFQVPIASPGVNYVPTIQGSQVRNIEPTNVPGVQSVPGTQESQARSIVPANVPGVQPIPGTQGQVRNIGPTNVPGVQPIHGTQGQIRNMGPTNVPGVQPIPGTQGQVRNIGPANVPGVQPIPGIQGQVRTVGQTNVPGVQPMPGTQSQVRNIGPANVPGVQPIPGTQGQVRNIGPANVPGVQPIPGTQGQVRNMGPSNVPGVQSIPGAQGQVRNIGPANVPGVQPIPGTQGQVRNMGPSNVYGVQSIPGIQGQVRTVGPTNVPGVQPIPGTQASQVRNIGPTNVPGVQSVPGTQGSQARTVGQTNVPGDQSVPGTQGQVRTVGQTNVPGVQPIPGTQASQVRAIGPANVPGTQFIPGTYGGPVRTQYPSPEAGPSRVLTEAQIVSSIASTAAIVEVKNTLTTQTGQVSKQNGEPNSNSMPAIPMPTYVQSVTGSQAQNLASPSLNTRQNLISPTAATPPKQDVTVAVAEEMSPAVVAATSTTEKSASVDSNSESNAIKESDSRVPQSFLPSSILAPQTREIVEAAKGRVLAEGPNPGVVSVGSVFTTPGSQIPSHVGVASNAQNQISPHSPNIPSLASKLPGSFPVQQKPSGAIIGDRGTLQNASKISSAEAQNEPRSREGDMVPTSGNQPPVSTSPPISQILVKDTDKSAAEHHPQISPVQETATATSGNKPDENPQNPTIPNRANDQQNPNPSTDRPTQSPQQK